MPVSTSTPATTRVPFSYVEFDNSNANRAGVSPWRLLLLGQKITAGTAPADIPVRVTGLEQARTLFGTGSMLALMFETLFANNSQTEAWAVPQVDNGAGVSATATVTLAGTASAAGVLTLYIAGRKITVAVTNGMTAAALATAVVAAVTAQTNLPVTATAATAVVTLTAKNKGECGNSLDVRANFFGEDLPPGITVTCTAFASGAANPTITAALAAIGAERYQAIVMPYTDATNLTSLETELANRWGPQTQNDGHAFAASTANLAGLSTLGDSRNSPHLTIIGAGQSPTPAWEWSSAVAGVVAIHGAADPARPFQTLPLKNVLPPAVQSRFTSAERNILLYDGISTYRVQSGEVLLERLITTYQRNGSGAQDVSYLDVTTILTLSYLREDLRTRLLSKYPRHKLANDGTKAGAGQALVTPSTLRAEVISIFRDWEELGLVENSAQFKKDIVVERNITDPNRVDMLLPPDLVNSLMVTSVKIAFLLQ